MRSPLSAALPLLLVAFGCGSNGSSTASPDASAATTDISGWYQVTSDRRGTCGSPTTYSLSSPYLWVERLQDTFYVRPCTGTEKSNCTGTLFYDFTQPIDNGWSAEGGSAFFSAGCTLTYERATATLAGTELSLQSLKYSINQDIPQSACTLAAARQLAGPCTYETDLTASRL